MKKIIFVLFLIAVPLFAVMETLNMTSGARPMGLADACVAVFNDVSIAQYNPALFASLREGSLSVTYQDWLDDLNVGVINVAYPLKGIGVIGGGLKYVFLQPFKMLDDFGGEEGTLSGDFLYFKAALGRNIMNNLSAGVSLNITYDRLQDYSFVSGSCDVGGLYSLNLKKDIFNLGFALKNIGLNISRDAETKQPSLPLLFALGSSFYTVVDIHSFMLTVEGDYLTSGRINLKAGVEYWYNKMFGIRGGYDYQLSGPGVFKIGGGIRQPVMKLLLIESERWQNLELGIDYSFSPYMAFGDKAGFTHTISISLVDRR